MRRLLIALVFGAIAALAPAPGPGGAAHAAGGGKNSKTGKGAGGAGDSKMREAARSFFQAAQVLYEKGKFREAALQFQNAFDEEPLAAFAYNAAQAWDRAGERDKAIASYKKYLEFKESETDAEQVKARLAVLEKELAAGDRRRPRPRRATCRSPTRSRSPGTSTRPSSPTRTRSTCWWAWARARCSASRSTRWPCTSRTTRRGRASPASPGRRAAPTTRRWPRAAWSPASSSRANSPSTPSCASPAPSPPPTSASPYREALGDDVTDKATPDVRKAAEAFLALFDEDVKENEEMAYPHRPRRAGGSGAARQVQVGRAQPARGARRVGHLAGRQAHQRRPQGRAHLPHRLAGQIASITSATATATITSTSISS